MIVVGSLITSPCCAGYKSEIMLIMPDLQTHEDVCLLSCENPDCTTSCGGVFTGMSCLPLAIVQDQADLLNVPAEPSFADAIF